MLSIHLIALFRCQKHFLRLRSKQAQLFQDPHQPLLFFRISLLISKLSLRLLSKTSLFVFLLGFVLITLLQAFIKQLFLKFISHLDKLLMLLIILRLLLQIPSVCQDLYLNDLVTQLTQLASEILAQ